MKRSQQCPKCRGKKLWVIEPFETAHPVSQHEHYHEDRSLLGSEGPSEQGVAVYVDVAERPAKSPMRLVLDHIIRTVERTRGRRGRERVHSTALTTGYLDAYVCAACGYTELYARDFDDLVAHPEGGIRLLDRSAEQQGAYR